MAIGGSSPYPTIQMVTNLVRSQVQDDMAGATSTIGEGQIFADNTSLSVTLSNFFNSALRILCRKLRTASGPMLIYDNYEILGIPPLVSPTQGAASPDTGLQVAIGFTGYFNGTTYNGNFPLPANCLMVERVWERVSGSNDRFVPLSQPPQGLPSVFQSIYNRFWEWRQDAIWMPGSLQTMDIRIRYQGQLLPLYVGGVNTATIYIPINDCQEALAGEMLKQMAIRQGPLVPQSALLWAKEVTDDFLNEWIMREQGQPYTVHPFDGTEAL